MKDYKYKINGNDYKVSIGDIENNIAHVEVNGVPYNVEIQETKAAPVTVKTVKPAAVRCSGAFQCELCQGCCSSSH